MKSANTTHINYRFRSDQRLASALGTTDNLGALCGDIFTNVNGLNTQSMMLLMDNKTQTAAQALDEDYTAFDKVLSLPQPLLYNGTVPSCKRYHTPDNYRVYWFHPDHLGSSSYISNLSGTISQHMEYLPFGETLVEEHKNSNNSPYKFNGKELDDETGNYYYGARYYNPKWSTWLSVDPLAEKYPSISPYAYTFHNPINLTDPTRMAPDNDYGLDKEGNITLLEKTDDKYDRLYATTNKNGDIKDKSDYVQINKSSKDESTILEDLTFDDCDYSITAHNGEIEYGSWGKTSNKQAAYKVFKYASDNSPEAEWVLGEFKNSQFVIGTNHYSESAAFLPPSGISELELLRHYHSHPGFSLTDNKASNLPGIGGDMQQASRVINEFLKSGIDYSKHPSFHIYRPALNKSFQYSPWKNKFNEQPIIVAKDL